MDTRDARALDLNPLFREPGIVYVSYIEMVSYPGTVYIVEKRMKLARA
jgi:hypothetical protein